MSKLHNFSAGPSILAPKVIEGAANAVKDLDNIGLSLIEISHRSKEFIAIMNEAQSLVREILEVPDNYSVLFLQGGASLGFHMGALNFMKEGGTGAYVNTGAWSKKAIKEGQIVGNVEVVASSEDANFNYIPKEYAVSTNWDYLHLTSNNTIFGTQIKNFPVSRIPVICDMSSDILSRKINVSDFDMIYAGAQKNLGPSGTTLYIINNDSLGKSGRSIPSMLNLSIHTEKGSMFNTPPVFAIYTCMLTLKWVKENGGIDEMEKRNEEKAQLLYNEIDSNPMFEGTAVREDRSNMNVTFVLKDEANKEEFDKMWTSAGISGVKGHRDVGGYRASIYNAMPKESIQVLVNTMKEFAAQPA